jgi:hypothetical protein
VSRVLNCQHHVSWVRAVEGGLHQCILCTAVVTKKDVYPKLEDLPEDFVRRWDAHEATQHRALQRAEHTGGEAARPAPTAPAAAPATATVAPTATPAATATATPTPTPTATATTTTAAEQTEAEESPTPPPIPRAPGPPRISVPPADPHPHG